ncbi:MAG TPA: hypothetical protein VHO91_21440 [Rhodopila sp.]|nr:hypothetical protein [Rhodopila sp.]
MTALIPARFRRLPPVLALLCLAGACSRPAVSLKPPSFQSSEVSVHDWNLVAQDIADRMADHGYIYPRPDDPGRASWRSAPDPNQLFYINVTAPDSRFLRQVRDALAHDILARGGRVSAVAGGATVINLDVDVIQWRNWLQPHDGPIGTATGLAVGTGVLLANGGPYSPATAFGIATGSGIALDLIKSMTPDTNVEAVWKASIYKDGALLMEDRAPVYIQADDAYLFVSRTHLSPSESLEPRAQTAFTRLRYAP